MEKSENFLFLHFATAHMIFQLFRNSIFRVLILRLGRLSKLFSKKLRAKRAPLRHPYETLSHLPSRLANKKVLKKSLKKKVLIFLGTLSRAKRAVLGAKRPGRHLLE